MERSESMARGTGEGGMRGHIGHRRQPSLLGGALYALLFSYAFAALLLLLLSLILSRLGDPVTLLPLLSGAAIALSGALGGFLSAKKSGRGLLLPSLLFSLLFCLFSAALTLLLNGGRLPLGAFLQYGILSLSSLLGAALGRGNQSGKRKKRRRR